MSSLLLRDASECDAPIIAKLIYETEDYPDHVWGEGNKDEILARISYLVKKCDSRYSYIKTKVAILDGEICGAIILLKGKEILKLDIKTSLSILFSIKNIKGKINFIKNIILSSSLEESKEDELYIANIGTNEKVRGRGIGKALMKLAEETAVREGYRRCSLLAKDKNLVNFYSRLDYRLDKVERYFSHDLYRMVKYI